MTKYCEEVSLNLERISQQIEKMEEQIKLGVNRKERRIMLSQIQQACCYLNKVDMLSHLDDEKN